MRGRVMFYPQRKATRLGCTCGTWDHIHEDHCGKPETPDYEAAFPDCGVCGRIYVDASCPEHGNLEPPVTHEARAVRHRRPGGCWRAECSCGWHSWWEGKEAAQHLAEAHSEGRMR